MSTPQTPVVTLVDIGIGNLRSVHKALEHVGAAVQLSADPQAIRSAARLLLPGVGAFGAGIDALRRRRLIEPLRQAAAAGVPLLGICLGMQLLFDESDELGTHRGLGLVRGAVRRFDAPGLIVPHVGWNQIAHDGSHPLLAGVPRGAHAYFVHAYTCRPLDPGVIIGLADYGGPFAAVVAYKNILGLQFHPEKSHHVGLRILRNFAQGTFS